MSIAISDALQQAQQAIEGGDYRSAVQTCNQLVNQFPDYAAAYRVLGEAYLEQGQTADAEQAFAQALMRDPRQPWAYHGLGLIAEKQDVLENALAFCQVAWELAPNHSRLRDPVLRIATRRFGADGQAQLTSAALAQIYSGTSRLQRAAIEYRSALADLPDRVDLKLGLAETLWQLGKNDEAADLCRQVLEENPVAIQALVVLADIEGREGHEADAADLRGRIRAIDPDGVITSMMLSRNDRADRGALLLAVDAIPVLDANAEAVVAARPHIAPAPDFTYQPARAEQPVQDIEDLEPITAEEFGTDLEQAEDFSGQDTSEIETVEYAGADPSGSVMDDAPSIYRSDEDDTLSGIEQDVSPGEPPVALEDVEIEVSTDEDLDALMAEFGHVEPMGIEEFGAEPEDLERLAAAAEYDLLTDDDDIFAGFTATPDADSGENEHVRSLASALESDVAGALDRTGEFQTVTPDAETELETEPEHEGDIEVTAEAEPASPDSLSGSGYTTVLRELGDEGITPFDPMGRTGMQESPAQAHFAGGDAGGDAESRASTDENEILKLTEDWESIDDEIARAVPLTTGQTDQLRAADDLGIAPFDFETEDDTSRLPAYRPFGEEDDELPELDAHETVSALEAETDGEDMLVPEQPAVEAETAPVPETGQVKSLEDELFDSLEPFSMEEFEDEQSEDQPFSFGSLPWETGDTGSAVPSDEDLELLLSPEDEAVTQPEGQTEQPAVEPDWPTRVLDTSPQQTDEPVDWTIAIQDQDDVVVHDETASVEAEAESDPASSPWNLPDDWDSSLAVTRQIGDTTEAGETVTQAGQEQANAASAEFSGADPESLVADEALFDRTRSAKTDLISLGAIRGDLDLAGNEPVIEPESEPELDHVAETLQNLEQAQEDDFVVTTAASRDVNTLRASLEAAPHDDELHWWLAEALRERGEVADAYNEYRWIIRNAGHRADDVITALNVCIENDEHAEMGHRLLADIYRRRGAVSLASSHAATAMAVRRRRRG